MGRAFCTCAVGNLIAHPYMGLWASQLSPVVKNLPANEGDLRNMGSIPGLGCCWVVAAGMWGGVALEMACGGKEANAWHVLCQ